MKQSDTFGNRYFYLAFSVAFFIFSILFLFLVTTVHPGTPKAISGEAQVREDAAEVYVPRREDGLTILFIGSKTGSVGAESYLLARFDPARGSVPIVVFPPQTILQNGDKLEPLSQLYEYGGADLARNALAQTLGISIDRYVRMNTDVFVACANTIGNVEFDLPHDLLIKQGGVHITLSTGKQLLDGKKVADIISYTGYEGGELERCQIAAELTSAIVNQRIDIVESTLVDKVFEKIINLVDTDISYPDYDNRKAAAQFMAHLQQNPATPIPVSGSFSLDGEQFTLSDTFLAILAQTM